MTALDAHALLTFSAVLLVAIASPGPAFLLAMRATLTGGRSAGLMAGVELAIVAAGWTLVALLGLDAVFRWVPWAYGALKVGGAAYLMYLAWCTWRSARRPVKSDGMATRRAFRDGLVVNLANPKSVLFSASVIVVLFPEGLATAEIALITINHLLLELVAGRRPSSGSLRRWMRRSAGGWRTFPTGSSTATRGTRARSVMRTARCKRVPGRAPRAGGVHSTAGTSSARFSRGASP